MYGTAQRRVSPTRSQLRCVLSFLQKLSGDQPQLSGPPDVRVSTITPASAAVLDRIGAWHALAPPTSAAFSSMQVGAFAEIKRKGL